ncbi:MAG TPA: hypothetical protein VGF50_01075 [Caulobacteraceae bacterium]|jgi:hypothetical protein
MTHLSEVKVALVKGLIEQAPDLAVQNLLAALRADSRHDESLSVVQSMIEVEATDRRARNLVFSPVAPLCAIAGPFSGLSFPPRALTLVWKALKEASPDDVTAAKAMAARWGGPDCTPELFDMLCAHAAAGLRAGEGTFGAAAAAADQGGGRGSLAACLDIAPVARRALDQMPQWLGRMTSEKAAKLRLAYRDAVGIADDAGPRFFEMLAAHLAEPWLILRVISGVMDRPGEAYVSGSELASFGERVLADIERRLAEVTAFKSTAGRPAARAAAQAVHVATTEIAELEQSFALTPDGSWGRRIARQKKTLAATIEAHLKETDTAVGHALPLHTVRIGPRTQRGVPRLTHDPEPALVEKAATLLIFMNEVRASAPAGGFASARAKALEVLEHRLDTYVEEVLEEIRADDGVDAARARAFLDVAAEFCGLARDEKSAQIVRRRAAVAA